MNPLRAFQVGGFHKSVLQSTAVIIVLRFSVLVSTDLEKQRTYCTHRAPYLNAHISYSLRWLDGRIQPKWKISNDITGPPPAVLQGEYKYFAES